MLQTFSLRNLSSLSLPVVQTGRRDKRVAEPAGQPRELLNDAAKLARLKWSHGIQTRFDIKQMDVNIVN